MPPEQIRSEKAHAAGDTHGVSRPNLIAPTHNGENDSSYGSSRCAKRWVGLYPKQLTGGGVVTRGDCEFKLGRHMRAFTVSLVPPPHLAVASCVPTDKQNQAGPSAPELRNCCTRP